jgi:hypothetical protein
MPHHVPRAAAAVTRRPTVQSAAVGQPATVWRLVMSVSTARHAKADASVSRVALPSPAWTAALALVVVMVVVGAVVEHYLARVTEWRVMADELLYLDMSRSMAHSLSPLPVVRGEHVAVYSVLYPLLLAPVVGLLDAPAAFQAIRVVNTALMVSTAVPAYLLAREASWRRGALIAATLSVLVPWVTAAASVMTEAAAYPAFTWAVYAMTRAIAIPSLRRDVLALAAIGIACLARSQFALLVVAFPVAVLVHEVGRRAALDGGRNVRSILVRGPLEAVRAHVVAALVVGIGFALLLFASDAVLGNYAITTTKDSLLPAGILGSALDHLAYIAVGIGALPVVFAIAFVVGTLGRPVDVRSHALASVVLVVVVATTLVVASFDLRFIVQGREVQERYLFYICPLLFAGAVAWFVHARSSLVPAATGAIATAGIVLSQHYEPMREVSIEGFASPNRYFFAVLDGRLYEVESWFGLHSPGVGSAIAAVCLLLAELAVALTRRGFARPAVAGFGIAIGVFLAAQLVYVLPRVVVDHNGLARTALGVRPLATRDWVDQQVPERSTGAVVGPVNARAGRPIADPLVNLGEWWDLAFWNESVDRIYRFGDYNVDALVIGPIGQLSLDFGSGALSANTAQQSRQLVLATSDVRFAPEYRGSPVRHGDATLYRTPLPYRAGWATRGVDDDGTTHVGRDAVVRVFGDRGAPTARTRVRILLSALIGAGRSHRYTVTSQGVTKERRVRTSQSEQLEVCVPASGHADVTLRVHGRASGLRILQIDTRPTRARCRTT